MDKYGISGMALKSALENPDRTDKGQFGRKIAQKALNGYILRIIYDEKNNIKTVITVYRVKKGRYEI